MSWCLLGAAVMCLLLAAAVSSIHRRHLDPRRIRPVAFARGCLVSMCIGGALLLAGFGVVLIVWQV